MEKGGGVLMLENCFFCGGEVREWGVVKASRIEKCLECGGGKTVGENGMSGKDGYHRDEVYAEEEGLFQNIFKRRVRLIERFKKRGRVIEVGCSTGVLLELMKKKGWEVVGVEPSKKACGVARGKGIEVIEGRFEDFKGKEERFDVVIFNHVLEHVTDPIEVLKEARRLLVKDGLVFVDVPNFGSWSAKLLGVSWPYVLPEEHKWHFTKEAMFALFKRAGLAVEHYETRSGVWDYGEPLKEMWESLRGGKKRFFGEAVGLVPNWIASQFGGGTSLTAIGKKYEK